MKSEFVDRDERTWSATLNASGLMLEEKRSSSSCSASSLSSLSLKWVILEVSGSSAVTQTTSESFSRLVGS